MKELMTLFGKIETSKYDVQLQETDKNIEIHVCLPGFTKKDIATAIKESGDKKCLVIKAKKEDSTKEKKEKKDAKIKTYEQYSSYISINGQEQYVKYENGDVSIIVDIPKNAALDSGYTMELKNDKLVLKIAKTQIKLEKKSEKKLTFTK
ncbi:MAG: hypothetical protein ABH827_01215 [bacterium]